MVKNPPANVGDIRVSGLIPETHVSRKFPGEGHGDTLQHSCLENLWTEEPGGQQSMVSGAQSWA